MKADFQIHPIQAKALRVLLFQTEAKFCELNVEKVSTDQFNFHLKSLVEVGLLEKKSNKYLLTNKGKEFANRFDTEKVEIERQAKITLAVVPVKTVGKTRYYLVHQRLKQPYYGYHGTINGKIRWGEKVFEAAKRELFEETGLVAEKMTMLGVFHKSDYSTDKLLLEDKYFFRVRVDKFSGKLKETVPEGKNSWMTKAEIGKLKYTYKNFAESLDAYDQEEIRFVEKDFLAEGY
jgi:ADP-ribose pyrophosphatase YjhB (NUDIX family)